MCFQLPLLADLYVLIETRSRSTILRFLDHFLPFRLQSAAEYELPQFAEAPTVIFSQDSDVIAYCEQHSNEPYSLYWCSGRKGEPQHAMVHYTTDGCTILGLSVGERGQEEPLLQALKEWSGSDIAYVTDEMPPHRVSGSLSGRRLCIARDCARTQGRAVLPRISAATKLPRMNVGLPWTGEARTVLPP